MDETGQKQPPRGTGNGTGSLASLAKWTIEDLRRARLPNEVWRELFAQLLIHAAPRNARLVNLALKQVWDLASDFEKHGFRFTPECINDLRGGLLAFSVVELDQRRIRQHRWPVLDVHVAILEKTFQDLEAERPGPDRRQWEAALRPWWRPKGREPFPRHLVDNLLTKHRRPFPRAIEFVATLHRIDPNHLRREILAWRKKVKANRVRLAR